MNTYLTHHFAHVETLDRAYRWLLQIGIEADRIETHRDGAAWISVRLTKQDGDEARMIFEAAERNDPDGWPSFWEFSRVPTTHVEPSPETAARSTVLNVGPSPVGWHPVDRHMVKEVDYGVVDVFDVTTRFA